MKRLLFLAFGTLGTYGVFAAQRTSPPVLPVVQEGDWNNVEALALSREGKLAASATCGKLQFWTPRGELIRTVSPLRSGTEECGTTLDFTPDGRTLLATLGGRQLSQPRKTLVFAAPSGRLLRTLFGYEVAAGGTRLVRRDAEKVRVFDMRKRLLGSFPSQAADGWLETLDFSPDARLVASAPINLRASDGTLRIYDVASGQLRRALRDPRGAFGKEAGVTGPVAWSPDGRLLATGGEDPTWQLPPLSPVQTESFYYHAYALKIWDWRSGKVLHVWRGFGSNQDPPRVERFLDNTRVLVDGKIVRVATGRIERELTPYAGPSALSHDGKTRFEVAALRDTATGKTRVLFPGSALTTQNALAFSPDGTRLAVSDENSILLFDARTGAWLDFLPLGASSLRWKNSRTLLGDGLNGIRRWEVAQKLVATEKWKPARNFNQDALWSPNGERILTWRSEYRNGKTDRMYPVIEVREGSQYAVARQIFLEGEISGSGNFALRWLDDIHFSRGTGEQLEIYSALSGQLERALPAPSDLKIHNVAALSRDLRTFAAFADRSANGYFSAALLFHTGEDAPRRIDNVSTPFALSDDGKLFAAMRGSRAVIVDTATGGETLGQPFFDVQPSFSAELAFSPDARFLIGRDGTALKWFDTRSGQARLSLRAFSEPQERGATAGSPTPLSWLALTPNGFYNGSPDAERWLRWRRGDTLLPVGALKRERRRPDLIGAILGKAKLVATE